MKPFLKWAGGKFKIIDHISAALPKGSRLVEPFVGSGAVFLNTEYKSYLLADTNIDLINLFKVVQKDGENFIDYAINLFTPENNNEATYYTLRDEFNSSEDIRRKAALFIYLNRHCFNGLCRYNARGKFNVPFGRYSAPSFPTTAVKFFSLKSQSAEFVTQDFRTTLAAVRAGDVVYCDPPYAPLSPTANFTAYTQGGFDDKDQRELATFAEKLKYENVAVILSNHDTAFTRDIYSTAQITTLNVRRFISSKASERGKAAELIAVF